MLFRVNRLVTMIGIGLTTACVRTRADTALESRAAVVLSQRFESVIGARPDLLTDSIETASATRDSTRMLRLPFLLLISGWEGGAGRDSSHQLFHASEAALVGAQDFRAPSGIGPVRSLRCYVLLLRRGHEIDLRRHFGAEPIEADGLSVWRWTAETNEFGEADPRPSELFATVVNRRFVLLANDDHELRFVAGQLSSADSRGDVLEVGSFPSVSDQRLWAYRRYRHASAHRDAAGLTPVSQGAHTLRFSVDPRSGNGTLTLTGDRADVRTTAAIDAARKLPQLKSTGDGVWQTSLPLARRPQADEQVFAIMWLFGFGFYL